MAKGSTIAERIQQRLEALGLSVRGASLAAGGSESTIRNILDGRSENPRGDTLRKLAPVLGVTEQWLLTGSDEPPSEVRPANVKVPRPTESPRDVPVYGTVAGSELGRGAFQLTTDVVDYVRRPAGLEGARDAYALYVEGESMVPRFEPGNLVFVHPHRKPVRGDYVVIQEPDSDNGGPRGFIKRLVRVTATRIVTEQFNPPATIEFVLRPGTLVHKVMTDDDLYGI